MTQPPKQGHEQHQSASSKATEKAKTGQPLRPDDQGKRSPKQENL